MSLSTFERNVFTLLEYFYFYLYRFPLQWDADYIRLSISKPYFPYIIPFVFFKIYAFAYAIICGLTVICFNSQPTFKINEQIILFISGYSICAIFSVIFVIFTNIHQCLDFYNQTMQMANKIQIGEF